MNWSWSSTFRSAWTGARSACLAVLVGLWATAGSAQEPDAPALLDPEQFDQQSAALRTALHYDPSLEAPLANLAKLYGAAERGEELLSIYRTHTIQYPQDEGARVVLIRLLREMRKPGASALIAQARKDFPQSALIAYLSFQDLESEKDPRALDALSEAITVATKPARKRVWIDQLVDLAIAAGRPDLARKHLGELAEAPNQSAEILLSLARRMAKAKFHELALPTLDKARALNAPPELTIDIELEAAEAEAALGRTAEAGARLDQLMESVAADYWRRAEIVSRRVNLLRTDAEREAMLKLARARYEARPSSEAAALDLGELLVACELRRDALAVYLESSDRLPRSEALERAAIGIFDRLNDLRGLRDYLELRLQQDPGRADLEYRLVKAKFVSGESSAALGRFDLLLGKLDEAARVEQTLDLARYLVRMGVPSSAADLFARVVEQAPQRLEVRRELAEAYLAVGKRQEARRLFDATFAEGAEIENFIDVIQFMVQQEILLEAKAAIAGRLESDGENFELQLILLDVQGKLGDEVAGDRLLESTRAIADTEARYRSWFEAGVKFHELFETLAGFLDREQARLVGAGGGWTPARVAQLLVFCEVADRPEERARVIDVVRAQIGDVATPTALRLELRRLLVRLIDRDPASGVELGAHLEALELEDIGRADEYRLRMAQMHIGAQRPDLGMPYLDRVDITKIGDSRLLAGLPSLFIDRGEPRNALAVLERIAKLEPTNRSNWETWLTYLAAMGEEAELRQAIRRLILGIERMPLSEDTHSLLRGHLIDSYWRSIAQKLAAGDRERIGEIFSFLDAIESSRPLREEQLWVLWTRAHVLGMQGRARARGEALAQLEQAAEALQPESQDDHIMISFPDGLALSLGAALRALQEQTVDIGVGDPRPAPIGPLPDLVADWAFETDWQAHVIQTLPLDGGDVILLDQRGTVYRVDGASGKLRWSTGRAMIDQVLPPAEMLAGGGASGRPQANVSRPVEAMLLPQCVADADGNVIVPVREHLLCLSGDDGRPRWVASMEGEPVAAHAVSTPLLLFLDGERVLAFNRASSVASAFDRRHGKLLWERQVVSGFEAAKPAASPAYGMNDFSSGASYSAGRLLVYGWQCTILDSETGATIWQFEPASRRSFPIKLKSPEIDLDESGGSLMPVAKQWLQQGSEPQGAPSINYLAASQSRRDRSTFARQGGELLAPAADWARLARSGQPCMGILSGERVLLFGSGIDILSLDLPLAGLHRNLYRSSFAGISGNKACFISDQRIEILNLSRGTRISADLSPVVDQSSSELQVAVAGARVYASGRKGILCLNLHSGGEIFRSPWPEAVTRFFLLGADGAAGDAAAPDPTNQRATYYWQGRVSRASVAPLSPYQPTAMQGAPGVAPLLAACYPVNSAAAGGRLFALVAPHRLVALSHVENHQSEEPDASELPD